MKIGSIITPAIFLIACGAPAPMKVAKPETCTTVASASSASTHVVSTIEGAWHGALGGHLHLALSIERAGDRYAGVLDSVDQNAKLPMDHITFNANILRFEIPLVGGVYEGTLDASGKTIAGKWTQTGVPEQPLEFAKGALEGAKRESPPPPLDAPIDVAVITSPSVLRADDHAYFVYELNVTSFSHRSISLRQIDVESHGTQLLHLDGATLATACARPATSDIDIGAGEHAIVFMWVQADGPAPTSLDHKITVRVGDADMTVANVHVPVRDVAPIVIAPPLHGGTWMAANGPSNTSLHRRALIPVGGHAHIAQRFAIDWVKVDADHKTFQGDRAKNESYYAYGAEALAVADGVVTETKDAIPQNVPGSRAVPITLETLAGNHVVVDLGNGHFAFWAHFQPGSLRVKVGERVHRGQVIGLVGNSGNSTEPHLHFHIMDASSPIASEGVPYAFDAFNQIAPNDGKPDGKPIAHTKQLPTEKELVTFR